MDGAFSTLGMADALLVEVDMTIDNGADLFNNRNETSA